MQLRQLSKTDTNILKGLGILCILAHNFFHWIGPIARSENETEFKSENFFNFINAIVDNPLDSFNIIFSYLGHFGVQIFIFISGYGLTMSMLKTAKPYKDFIIDRAIKLYPLVFVGIASHFLMTTIIFRQIIGIEGIRSLTYKMLMIHTLIPGEAMSRIGPLWFTGMIFQLYLLFPLLFKLIMQYGVKALVAISVFAYTCIYPCIYFDILPHGINIMVNSIGHLPEFCLGILFAKSKCVKISPVCFIVAVTLFGLGNVYKAFYPLTFISFTYIILCVYNSHIMKKINTTVIKKFFVFFGELSMMLFAVHGVLRYPFIEMVEKANNTFYQYIFFTVFVICTIFVALGARNIYERIVNLLASARMRLKQK